MLVGTCGLVGRLGAGLGLVASVHLVLLLVTSVVLDCLHKEGLCRKVGFWRPNPKIGYQKINDLRVSTFLFSVICDRAQKTP